MASFRQSTLASLLFGQVFAIPPSMTDEVFSGEVIRVQDGQHFTIKHKGRRFQICLAQVVAPTLSQAYGSAAKKALSDMILGKTVQIKTHDSLPEYILSDVYIDDHFINAELIEQGFVRLDPSSLKDKQLSELERKAQTEQQGLWVNHTMLKKTNT